MHLTIHESKRHFALDGKPFFWLGDTAWLMFQKLTFDEIMTYLDNRAAKGYNVIQATLVHKMGYANRNGSTALLEDDFSRPNPDASHDAYWPMVRRVVDEAAKRGMFMALLPSWGAFVSGGHLAGDKIDVYTDHLAKWFADCENVLWLVGGDERGSKALEDFNRIGRALKAKCPGHLVGYHPFGRCTSSMWFHNEDWLDFNMFQSGHRRYDQIKLNQWDDKVDKETYVGEDSYRYVQHDRALDPVKPVLDGEPSYEQIPQGLHDATQPFWQSSDVRRYAYWSLMAGASGFTYGSNSIMQFWCGVEKGAYGVREVWQEAMHHPGASQMAHVRTLMESVDWYAGVPAQELLVDNVGEKYAYNLALDTPKALCVYTHTGAAFAVNTAALDGELTGCWFDPEAGVRSYFGKVEKAEKVTFTPPNRFAKVNDWVLLLEKASA